MAQSANNTNCPFNLENCPFNAKAVCITAFLPPKSALEFGIIGESEKKEDAELKISVGVYHSDGSILYILNFTDPLKALRYAYVLKEREECPISKYSMELLKSAVKAKKTKEDKSEPQPEPTSEPVSEPIKEESTPEPTEKKEEQKAEEKPKRKAKKNPSMQKQYEEMKKKHPDAVLLFRVGDFYEVFDDDAVKAADILGITLTSRKEGKTIRKLAGFPNDALDTYLPKLVRAGERVAICEQLRG